MRHKRRHADDHFAMSDMALHPVRHRTVVPGLGVQPPDPGVGPMITEGKTYLAQQWMVTFPLAIVLTGIGLSLLWGWCTADRLRPK